MTILEIGCCGAYCKTCMQWQRDRYPNQRACLGCKLGYESGERNISKAKCKMKICCFGQRKLQTCADCPENPCEILLEFYNKKGEKYKRQKNLLEFIKEHGYDEFLKHTDKWKGPRGKLK
jgi:hypothetical protein